MLYQSELRFQRSAPKVVYFGAKIYETSRKKASRRHLSLSKLIFSNSLTSCLGRKHSNYANYIDFSEKSQIKLFLEC